LQGVAWNGIFISTVEHSSVYKAHVHPHLIPVTTDGILDLNALEKALQNSTGKLNLVSVVWGNNETGILQPLQEIIDLAHGYGALVHTDAVQVIGKLPIHFKDLNLDLMTVSAHKFGGPQGVGALIVRPHVPLVAMLRGGGQEKNRRSGTENTLAIAGFAEALTHAPSLDHLSSWHRQMEATIAAEMQRHPDFKIIGRDVDRLPNITCLTMPGMLNDTQVMAFDLAGIAVSAGSACSSGTVKSSRILQNMGLNPAIAQTTIRVTSGWNTSQEELTQFTTTWLEIYAQQTQRLTRAAS
jgi:cysteine desulfurase